MSILSKSVKEILWMHSKTCQVFVIVGVNSKFPNLLAESLISLSNRHYKPPIFCRPGF